MQTNYDAIIIGFGKGGKTLAGFLADLGQSVALIERSSQMYGGTCINIACIPTKTLVHEARLSFDRQHTTFAAKAEDYAKAIARKNEVTGFLREKNYAMLADRHVLYRVIPRCPGMCEIHVISNNYQHDTSKTIH